MKERSPWFPFYVSDFVADENVRVMSNRQVGIYAKALCHAWSEGSLPPESEKIAKIVDEQVSDFEKLWPLISVCFKEIDGRLYNPRLEKERKKAARISKDRRKAGRKGGIATQRRNRERLLEKSSKGQSLPERRSRQSQSHICDCISNNNLPRARAHAGGGAPACAFEDDQRRPPGAQKFVCEVCGKTASRVYPDDENKNRCLKCWIGYKPKKGGESKKSSIGTKTENNGKEEMEK
jgi:uncharacterized protein YdaU (DUF1376 family)